jgi:thiol-disulfide isomerase/thioredoxin
MAARPRFVTPPNLDGGPAMRGACRLILAGLLCGVLSCPGLAASPKEGQPVPQFELATLDERVIASTALRGKVTLVHFWATWCPPCVEEMPALDKFYREHRQDGFEVVAISVEDAADESKVRDFARRFAFPVAMKGSSKVDGFGRLWALPLSFLIDRRQIVRKSDWTGAEKIDAASLEKLVRPLLSED